MYVFILENGEEGKQFLGRGILNCAHVNFAIDGLGAFAKVGGGI